MGRVKGELYLCDLWGWSSLDVGLHPSRERSCSNADTVYIVVLEACRLLIQQLSHLSKEIGGIARAR